MLLATGACTIVFIDRPATYIALVLQFTVFSSSMAVAEAPHVQARAKLHAALGRSMLDGKTKELYKTLVINDVAWNSGVLRFLGLNDDYSSLAVEDDIDLAYVIWSWHGKTERLDMLSIYLCQPRPLDVPPRSYPVSIVVVHANGVAWRVLSDAAYRVHKTGLTMTAKAIDVTLHAATFHGAMIDARVHIASDGTIVMSD